MTRETFAVRCASCGLEHEVTVSLERRDAVLVFGGGARGRPFILSGTCPVTGEAVDWTARITVGEAQHARATVVDVRVLPAGSEDDPGASAPPDAGERRSQPAEGAREAERSAQEAELRAVRAGSQAALRAFGTTLLGTSTGAVAVYFAVLKYLGTETATEPRTVVAVVPAIGFLVAAGLFAWALRPALRPVSTYEEFLDAQTEQLLTTHRRLTVATGTFLSALALSCAGFAWVLYG